MKEYALIHPTAKNVLLTVKKWAKTFHVGSAKDDRFSSYAWANLTIYYLQAIGFLPNLQSKDWRKKMPLDLQRDFCSALDTRFCTWKQIGGIYKISPDVSSLPVSILFFGFLHYYTSVFYRGLYATSIQRFGQDTLLPKAIFPKATLSSLSIEDPFERHDSYCPHDLGSHANEKGQELIFQYMMETKEYLQKQFEQTCTKPSRSTVKDTSSLKAYMETKEYIKELLFPDVKENEENDDSDDNFGQLWPTPPLPPPPKLNKAKRLQQQQQLQQLQQQQPPRQESSGHRGGGGRGGRGGRRSRGGRGGRGGRRVNDSRQNGQHQRNEQQSGENSQQDGLSSQL